MRLASRELTESPEVQENPAKMASRGQSACKEIPERLGHVVQTGNPAHQERTGRKSSSHRDRLAQKEQLDQRESRDSRASRDHEANRAKEALPEKMAHLGSRVPRENLGSAELRGCRGAMPSTALVRQEPWVSRLADISEICYVCAAHLFWSKALYSVVLKASMSW